MTVIAPHQISANNLELGGGGCRTNANIAALMSHENVAGFTIDTEALYPAALRTQSSVPDLEPRPGALLVVHLDGDSHAAGVRKLPILVLRVVISVISQAAPAFVAAHVHIFLPDA